MTTASGPYSDAPAAVIVDRVTKTFPGADGGTRTVLDRVDLVVGRGECLGVIGPNGAGKSTLLQVLAGVTPPSAGSVRRPRDIASLIELGVAVSPELTGRENARLLATLWASDRSAVHATIVDGLRFADLGPAEDWPVWKYSSGMLARLVFGVATARTPELLVVDEVLSVGDIEFQHRGRNRLAELRRCGTTVVIVSHDMDLIASTCDRALILDDGVVTLVGDPLEVIREYLGQPPDEVTVVESGFATSLLNPAPVMAGDDLRVRVHGDGPGRLRLELVLDEHPALQATHNDPIFVGGTDLEVEPGQVVRVPTPGLPPLRYSLHASLDQDGVLRRSPACRVVLEGPMPELCTLQLECDWVVDRVDAGPGPE